MKKYAQIFTVGWETGFVYRLNFVMWRLRTVLQLLTLYFLWSAVLRYETQPFGYTAPELLTYVLGTSFIRAVVFSSQSTTVQADISTGDLNNYLVKPVNYFGYWLSRDYADKLLNIIFSVVEIIGLYLILRPPLVAPPDVFYASSFVVAVVLATFLYFFFSFIISLTVFWLPEGNGWSQRFFVFVVLEFLSGALYPLDVLPPALYRFLMLLPTAYFLNTPLQIYLGRLTPQATIISLGIMICWLIVLYVCTRFLFAKGVRNYGAYGR